MQRKRKVKIFIFAPGAIWFHTHTHAYTHMHAHTRMDVQKNKTIIAVCPLTLTDVHSLARPNELLSYVSICCLSMTWVHCVPFLSGSFTHYHTASIFSGALAVNEQWRRYRRTYENACILVQKRTDKDVSMPTHRPRAGECESLRAATSYLSERRTFNHENLPLTLLFHVSSSPAPSL